ncbi:PucR family transcriptional regulator [Sciscionella sediminilitoris]|uniref:PucR family transcriptional regulator n=1 Tax=Sciscionella sediminilitoris TaxID=1445613 RepID=UPI0004DFB2E3|nr:helix-turn-helix domain-containing protein [Sciscionella sp. SE31]
MEFPNLIPLRQVLLTLGESLLELSTAPDGVEVGVRDVVIADPEDEPRPRAGDLVLLIGARGRAAIPVLRAAARSRATAIAVKGVTAPLRDAASDAGIALLAVHPAVSWAQLTAVARAALDDARVLSESESGVVLGDLFALAQTIATLTGGIVSIEDTASRVLAYSRSSGEVDELRRLSILGQQGPEEYLALLRKWGVFDRLRSSEEVVRIEERPESGIRRRLAVGIFAGRQPLGTIWVQEGGQALHERAERALLGAARVTALHLVRRRGERSAHNALREGLLNGLLEGRLDVGSVASEIGADPAKPAAVAAFALLDEDEADRSAHELRRLEMTSLIAVHAAAYRRSALATTIGARVYVLLPDLPEQESGASVLGLAREIVTAGSKHAGFTVRAAVGSPVPRLEGAAESRQEADRVLDAAPEGPAVATIEEVRSAVLLAETLAEVRANERIRDPRITALLAHDRENGGELAASLLAYLDSFGDVRSAATELGVHPNTLRYRVRRAGTVAGLDLGDARERLVAQLQLRLLGR